MTKVTAHFGAISKVWTDRKYRQNRKLLMILSVMSLLTLSQLSIIRASAQTTKSYQNSSEDFANPERGFFVPIDPAGDTVTPLQLSTLQSIRSKNITLVRRIYVLKDFRNQPLSQSFLDMVAKDLETARQAGVKLVIKFSYNWIGGGADAPRVRILGHLDQLKPILQANYDVIAYLHAGFIGYWGEWHSSTNNLLNTADMQAIVFKILSVLPPERMVALRYPKHKVQIYANSNPLTSTEGYNGTNRARTGHVNECFLASKEDWGTYSSTNSTAIENEKNYLNQDSVYVVQGGETCNSNSDAQQYIGCTNAKAEMARMRWRELNSVFEAKVIQGWKDQGCYPEIQRRLGYRFRLNKSVIAETVKPGGTFNLQMEMVNDGWGNPFNYRRVEVILRNTQLNKEYYLQATTQANPRYWLAGTTQTINIQGGLPTNISPGSYEVLLNLPDATNKLYRNPKYSIRLANTNVWESSTGYNKLFQTLNVSTSAAGTTYSGSNLFNLR